MGVAYKFGDLAVKAYKSARAVGSNKSVKVVIKVGARKNRGSHLSVSLRLYDYDLRALRLYDEREGCVLTAVCDDALWNVPRLKCERLVEVRDHLCTTDVYSMQQRAPSEILGFVKVRPENYCKSVKVWCLRNSCKTVKVSDLPETLPPPYGETESTVL